MMGEVAATLLSRLAVPVVYYLIARRGWTRGVGGGQEDASPRQGRTEAMSRASSVAA